VEPALKDDMAEDAAALSLDDGYVLPGKIAGTLYPHQREGVQWLWSIYKIKKGGILGDDMGLGKTMQCSAFLAGSFHSKVLKRAIIIAPKTLLAHWEKELRVCGLGNKIYSYYGTSEREREESLRVIARRGGILLTTYGMGKQ
jgi:SNF2 family DNA or RNA helicase